MKLEYSVVAVDDEPTAAASFEVATRLYLEDEGFGLTWRTCATRDEVEQYLKSPERPDVLLVDDKLGAAFQSNGPHWAVELRRHFSYTDILFYGGASVTDLRRGISEALVDGVYCATRQQVTEVLREIATVHIHKWTDAGAMRGLAVGIATEFDNLLRDICIELAKRDATTVAAKFHSKIKKLVDDRSKKRPKTIIKMIESGDFGELIRYHPEIGAVELARAITWLSDCLPDLVDAELARQFNEQYLADVIHPRNTLAHGTYDSAKRRFTSNQGEFELTPDQCRKFRVTLRSYLTRLRTMRESAMAGSPILSHH